MSLSPSCQCLQGGVSCSNRSLEGWRIYSCIIIGLLSGVGIGFSTEFFTSYEYPMVRSITEAGVTGPATVIIQGLGIGERFAWSSEKGPS